MMKTTLRKIKGFNPGASGWKKLCEGLGTTDLDTEVTILQILEINGVEDAYWALRTQEYKDYCLILAHVAESVLHFYENEYTNLAPRKAIEGIRLFQKGEITREELKKLVNAANAAAYTAYAAEQWRKNEEILRKYLGALK